METLEFPDVVRALVENALDEARSGGVTAIAVEVSDDAIRVSDDGRGLPVHPHPRSGRPLLEVIMTGPRRGPRNTLARVNAACLWVEVEVHRDGELWFQRYELARPAAPLQQRGSATRQGTSIACAPARGEAPDFDGLRDLVRHLTEKAGLGEDVKVRVRDLRVERDERIA